MKTTVKAVLLLILAASALFVLSAWAQDNGTLSGIVSWRSTHFGEGVVAGALVTVYDNLDVVAGQDTTALDGSYSFSLSPGIYHALFSRPGYNDSTILDILIISNQLTEADIYLHWNYDCRYYPGGVGGGRRFTGLDVVYGISFLKGGPEPWYPCECTPGNTWYVAGDVNGSCTFTGLDISFMVAYLKGQQPALIPCPDCPPVGYPYR